MFICSRIGLPQVLTSRVFQQRPAAPVLTHATTRHLHSTMAKARVSLQQIDVHEDDQKEEEVNSELGESMDPLDESGHTVNSSDEEVEDAVAEDMSRFEETFVGINKRFRLINRIGEGESSTHWLAICWVTWKGL